MANMYTPEEKAEIEARAADEIKRLGAVTIETKMAMMDMSVGVKGFTASLTKGFGQLGSSALGLTKQLADGEIGASVFNKSIGGVADALGDLLGLIPYVGGALKTLVKGASEYTQAVNKQADLLYSNYQKMSEMGASAADGMQGVYDNLKRMNYGTDELDKFVSIVKENSSTLANFGGTVSQGLGQIASVSSSIQQSNMGRQFRDMGISVDEVNKGIASYTKLQMLSGARQKMSADEQAIAAANYIKETDLLAKITGKNREQQEQSRESALAEERYAAYKTELEQRAAMGDTAAAEQLKQVERTQIQLDKVAPETRKGFLNILSNSLNTPEAKKLLLTMPNAAAVAGQETFTQAEFMAAAQKDAAANVTGYAKDLAKMGVNNETFIAFQEQNKLAAMKATGTVEEQLAAAEAAQTVTDKTTQNMTDLQDANRASRDKLQDLINAGITPVTTGMKGLATATDATIETMTKLANAAGVTTKKRDEPGAAAQADARPGAVGEKPTSKPWWSIFQKSTPPGAAPEAAPAAVKPPAPAPVDTAKIDAEIARFTKGNDMSLQANKDYVAKLQSKKAGATPAAAPAAAKPAAPAAATTAPATAKPAAPAAESSGKAIPKPSPKEPEGSGAAPEKTATQSVDLTKILKFGNNSGSQQNFEALQPTFKSAVVAAATEYHKLTGSVLQINSAKRDPADQQRIWDESVAAGRTGVTATGMPIGKPGRSLHERGEAVDVQNYRDPNAVAALNKYGLTQKVPRDPVHFQAKDGGVVPPLPGGSNVLAGEAGQAEAIIPLKNGAVPVTMPKDFVDSMSKYNFLMDQIKGGLGETNISPEFKQEMEGIKSQAMANAGPGAEAMLAAFTQMSSALIAQGEANRAVLEEMLRGQKTSNNIQSDLLKYAQ
jgi:hypothetical protein